MTGNGHTPERAAARRRPLRRALAILLLSTAGSLGAAPQANPGFRHQLESREPWLLSAKPALVLAVAAERGRSAEVERLTRDLGGRVDYAHRPTDFLAVVLPTPQVDRFLAEAPLASFAVEKLQFNGNNPPDVWDPKPKSAAAVSPVRNARADWPPREGMAPVEHPHDVRKDMDGEAFMRRDAGNDGRGVVVAHLEYFPDFLSPELRAALDADGRAVHKFRDVINIPGVAPSLEPGAARKGWFWSHRLGAPAAARSGAIEVDGRRHRVPGAGEYRLALLDLHKEIGALWAVWPVLEKAFHGRRHPQGLEPEDPEVILRTRVLWSEADRTLWIDTDQDGDFDDETGVREYAAAQQIGVLGQDDPATVLRETVGYTVQADGDYVSVNMGFGSHVTAVAGAVAASRGKVGRIEGVAPGAQLIAISITDGAVSYARGLIAAYEHPATDVVLIEGHAGITTLSEQLLAGRSLVAVVLDRLQALHDKPTLFTAFNTPGMSTIADATVPENVISVGAYQSADAVYSNYGIHVRHQDDLHWAGSEGPAGNGILKPDLLAPANPTSLEPGNVDRDDGGKRAGVFRMIGYGICGGTSCATPVASGAAALLVGAAKREGLPVSGSAIHRALRDSARPLDRFPIYKQGRGLLQIDAAWQRLRQLAQETPETIEVAAPVKTLMSSWLPQADLGQGLFEREGWQAGQTAMRTITFKRTSGPETPVRYRVRWKGDAQAFASAMDIALPLNQAVPLQVRVSAKEEKTYSALLELHRDGLAGPATVVPATIVVPHRFTAGNGYTVEHAFELDRPGRINLFYDVPHERGLLRLGMPEGRKDARASLHAPDNAQGAGNFQLEQGGLMLPDPMPGSWQLMLMDMGDGFAQDWSIPPGQVLPRTRVKLEAAWLSVQARVEGDEVVLRNRGAAFDGRLRTRALAARRSETIALDPVQTVERTFTVEAGTEQLVVRLEPDQATHAAWAALYRCAKPDECSRQGGQDIGGRDKRIAIDRPEAGTWKVVVTHYDTAPGSVRLQQIHAHPKYGVLTSTDAQRARALGAEWRVPVMTWRRGVVPAGYTTVMMLDVEAKGIGAQPAASVLLEAVPVPSG